jgi:hypothetical protein
LFPHSCTGRSLLRSDSTQNKAAGKGKWAAVRQHLSTTLLGSGKRFPPVRCERTQHQRRCEAAGACEEAPTEPVGTRVDIEVPVVAFTRAIRCHASVVGLRILSGANHLPGGAGAACEYIADWAMKRPVPLAQRGRHVQTDEIASRGMESIILAEAGLSPLLSTHLSAGLAGPKLRVVDWRYRILPCTSIQSWQNWEGRTCIPMCICINSLA